MAKKNKKLGKGGYFIIGMLATALLALGGFAGYEAYENAQKSASESSTTSQNSESGVVASVAEAKNICAKVLRANETTEVVTFTTTPATYTGHVKASLAWTDSSVTDKVSDFVTYVFDEDAKTITLTLIDPFAHQATLKIYSEDNPDIYANVTVDYRKRVTALPDYITLQAPSSTVQDAINYKYGFGSLDPKIGTFTVTASVSTDWINEFETLAASTTGVSLDTDFSTVLSSITSGVTGEAYTTGNGGYKISGINPANITKEFVQGISFHKTAYDGIPTYYKVSQLTSSQWSTLFAKPMFTISISTLINGTAEVDTGNIDLAKAGFMSEVTALSAGTSSVVF